MSDKRECFRAEELEFIDALVSGRTPQPEQPDIVGRLRSLGRAGAKQLRQDINKAADAIEARDKEIARLHIKEIRPLTGSWECSCGATNPVSENRCPLCEGQQYIMFVAPEPEIGTVVGYEDGGMTLRVAPEAEPTTILRDPDLYCAQLTDPTAECYPDGHVPWYPTREEAEGEVDRLLKDGHKDWEEDVKVGLGDYDKPKREDYEVEPLWMGNPLKCAEPEPQERITEIIDAVWLDFRPDEMPERVAEALQEIEALFPTTEEPTP